MRIKSKDRVEIFTVSWLLIAALLVPPRYWQPMCRWAASIGARRRVRKFRKNVARISALIDRNVINISPEEIELRRKAAELYDRLLILKQYWFAGWRPPMRLCGAEKLTSALEQESGVILWVDNSAGSRLLVKMALYEAGFAVSHLSRPSHGFVDSEFGVSVLNRFWTRIEDRYLDERITFPERHGNRQAPLKVLRQRLKENRIVSITIGPWAKKMAEVPFFATRMPVATGPISLALNSNATLLPVFTNQREDGGFEVRIADPIELSTTGNRDKIIQDAAQRLAADVTAFIAENPGQWRGWFEFRPDPGPISKH